MSGPAEIKITVQLDYKDFRRGNLSIVAERLLGRWWSSLVQAMLFFCIAFGAVAAANTKTHVWLGALVGLAAGIGFWILFTPVMLLVAYVMSFSMTRSAMRSNPALRGPFEYTFSGAGLTYVGPVGKGEMRWEAFPWIRETRHDFLLFVHKNFAYIIPKRCFSETSVLEQFTQLLRTSYAGKLALL